jgi:hypothetical protein
LVAGCDRWPGGGSLAVEGATPYVRCLAADPPPDSVTRVGGAVLRMRDGALRIEGLGSAVTIAAFAGPGFASPPSAAQLQALNAVRPKLVLVLGGIGDSPAIAAATLTALASVPVPTLILAGGRDNRETIERAREGLEQEAAVRITDVTTARSISIGDDMFFPVAGALHGRYALHDDACGYAESDLEARDVGKAKGSGRKWLLAWEAPSELGNAAVSRDERGLDLGSRALAEFAARVGARGGLFAWPEVQTMRPSADAGHRRAAVVVAEPDLRLVVPRWTGPALERSDGSRVPAGFALLRLDRSGLALLPPAVP